MEDPKVVAAVVFLSVFAACGTIGNALVLYGFSRPQQKFTSTLFILTLAGIDLITCSVTIPFTIVMEIINFEISHEIPCKIYHFLITSTIPFSSMIMVAIAIDRYFCICQPFSKVITNKRVKCAVGVIAMFSTCLGMMSCLNYGVYVDDHKYKDDLFIGNLSRLSEEKEIDSQPKSDLEKIESKLRAIFKNMNISSNEELKKVYTQATNKEQCFLNYMLLGRNYYNIFEAIYSSFYVLCGILVIIIYIVIYRFILARRRRRMKMESFPCCTFKVPQSNAELENTEVIYLSQDASVLMEDKAGDKNHNASDGNRQQLVRQDGDERPRDKFALGHQKQERIRRNNIKTAIMLSLVAFVFIIAFLPAWLMKLKLVTFNLIVFNLYFIYNVINPFLYAFMNPDFQTQLKETFSSVCR